MDYTERPMASAIDAETLSRRPSRSRDTDAESRWFSELARELASDPEYGLQRLAEAVIELCRADSAAITVADDEADTDAYRWQVTAGAIGGSADPLVPHGAGPSAIALAQERVLVLSEPDRDFPELASFDPPVVEALVAPFWVDGKPAGAAWALSQTPDHRFAAEDGRILESLAGFASLGIQARKRNRGDRSRREDGGEDELTRARLAAIVASSEDAIVSKDLEGTIVSWNKSAERLFGYAPDEAIGQPITLIVPLDRIDEEPRILQRIRNGEHVEHFETVRQRKDGMFVDISLTVSPIIDGQGRVAGASKIARDITERKRADRALAESKEHLRRLSETLEQRVSERTAEIHRQTEQLRELAAELTTAEQRERRRLAEVLHDELQQLVVAAQIQLGQARERTNDDAAADAVARVGELLEQTMSTSRNLTRQLRPPVLYEDGFVPALKGLASDIEELYGLAVTVSWDGGGPALGDDHKSMLFESTRELLINTAKHAGVDHATVEVWYEHGRLHVSVSDEGRGFDSEGIKPRGDRTEGFGLFSMRERLAALGGDTRVDAAPGEGTRITLDVPVMVGGHTAAESVAEPSAGEDRTDARGASQLKVLLVDDHPTVRQGIARVIGGYQGIIVMGEAGDGAEAIEMMSRGRPDIVLMDVHMPGMNGIEATREVRRRWPEVIVAGLSVHDDTLTAEQMREAGAAGFITKSGDSDQMAATVRRLVEAARSER